MFLPWTLVVTALLATEADSPVTPAATPVAHAYVVTGRTPIARGRGVSALAPAGETLWALPERERELIHLDRRGKVLERVPLEGVPAGVDTESLAVLPDGRFAIGTEAGGEGRASDPVLLAERRDGRVVVTGRLELYYGPFGYAPHSNQGIEGLCRAGTLLIAAVEKPGGPEPRRTPLALFDLEKRRWRVASVPLTSATGTISALACPEPARDGQVRLLAIERHLGVGRVLELVVPVAGGKGTSRILVDYAALVPAWVNFEGLAVDGDDLLLVNDNDNLNLIVGDTALYRLSPATGTARR
jgi:hypothetical protein